MFGHPLLLLWHPKADPDEIGLCFVDGRNIRGIFFSRQWAERGRAMAGNYEPWVLLLQPFHHQPHDTWAAAIEVMPMATLCTHLAHRFQQFRARHALRI